MTIPIEKMPPANVDAEQAVLGACLIDSCTIGRLLDYLKPEDFFRTGHRLIYEAMLFLARKGWPCDVICVCDQLERQDQMQQAGGVGYIQSLVAVVPTAIHADWYGQLVRRTAVKRRLISLAGRIGAIGYDDEIETDDALAMSEALFAEIQKQGNTRFSGIITVDDLEAEVDDLYENGWKHGASTLWPVLDDHYHVCEGELTILTGIPSHGKSEFLDALLVGLAQKEDWRFLVSSPENPPAKHLVKLAEKYTDQPFTDGPTPRMTREGLKEAKVWIKDHFRFVLPYEGSRNVKAILNTMAAAMSEQRVNGIVLDPWNNFEHDHEAGLPETKYISRELTRLKSFAVKNHIHIWVVAHPRKLQKNPKTGEYPVPTAYDISDSSTWYDKADNIITIWRDVNLNNDRVAVYIQKVRFKQNGHPGAVELHWDRVSGQFHDASKKAVTASPKPSTGVDTQQEWT